MRYNVKVTCLDMLVAVNHLLRKIENTIDFNEIYRIVEHLLR